MKPTGPLESETCREYVLPRLQLAGWDSDGILEQYAVTDGRIVPVGRRHRREKPLRADYLLHQGSLQLAVVEAKREFKKPADGLGQAIRYARMLGLPLAYSTNGKGIVERDFDLGSERYMDAFPSPAEALTR